MPLYRYQAISKEGKKVLGVINADSYELAKEMLRKQKVFVTKLLEYQSHGKEQGMSKGLLLAFTRDLSQLLKAGLPLYESLVALEEKYRYHPSHPLLLDLCDKVKQGKHLSEVLACYPKTFDQIYVAMISSAEETGTLPEVFSHLEKLIARQSQLRKQVLSSMIYPLFLLSFCLVVVVALFFFLIPSMQQLFEGRSLHPMTQAVLSISAFLHEQGLVLALVFVGGLIGITCFIKHPKGKVHIKAALLKIPVMKKLITVAALARFCRALSVMLFGGVPLIEGLQLSKKVMNHDIFEGIITEAEKKIMQGGKLSEELGKSKYIPSLVVRMLSIAEETGNFEEMLKSIAEIYEEELEKSLTRLTSMLQPVMLLVLAIVVGIVILSILLPLTDVGSFLNG